MTFAKRLQRLNVIVGASLLLAVNTVGALPRLYKGLQHPVGHDTVSVYVPLGEGHDVLTPVEEGGSNGFRDTGERVEVYLRNGYKDDIITFYPRVTVLVLLAMALIHFLSKALARGAE